MKYLDGFRNAATAKAISGRIAELAEEIDQGGGVVRIMEVCGTHTMSIARSGIRSILPPNVDLISGPGCPVCVTDAGYIDAAIELARRDVIITTFGDMVKVPGSDTDLALCRSEGATVQVCYSPLEAVKLAAEFPDREIVFLAIGFETTICPVISIIEKAKQDGITNLSLLTAFKLVPPALEALASSPDIQINAFLCPAHVSAIIGAKAYEDVVSRFNIPGVVAGFEPLDILYGLQGILEQIKNGEARVDNQYNRVVKPEGNLKALALMRKLLTPIDAVWRGIGMIPASGLGLREKYLSYDAEKKFSLEIKAGKAPRGCKCGDVLKGIMKPDECGLFGTGCTPQHPVGPCMVSSEGSCSAWFKYGGAESL